MKKLFRQFLCCLMATNLVFSLALPSVAVGQIDIDFNFSRDKLNAGEEITIYPTINTTGEGIKPPKNYTIDCMSDHPDVISVATGQAPAGPTITLSVTESFRVETEVNITLRVSDTVNGINGNKTLKITALPPPAIALIEITPPPDNGSTHPIRVGSTYSLKATAYYDTTKTQIANVPITWESDKPGIASVSVNGVVTGNIVDPDNVTISASYGTCQASTKIRVVDALSVSFTTPSEGNTIRYELKPEVSKTDLLQVKVLPDIANLDDLTNQPIIWESTDKSIVEVTPNSTNDKIASITSKGEPGTATIIATVRDKKGNTASARCQVTVLPPSLSLNNIEIKDKDKIPTLVVGSNAETKLSASLNYTNLDTNTPVSIDSTTDTVKWTSSNDKIATVWLDGTVRAVGGGEVTITATSKEPIGDSKDKFATDSVKIIVNQNLKRITLSNTTRELQIKETISSDGSIKIDKEDFELLVVHDPETSYPKMTFSWEVTDKDGNALPLEGEKASIVTVVPDATKEKATISAVDTGEVTITVTGTDAQDPSKPKQTASCKVTVTRPVTGIKLDQQKIELQKTKTAKLKATLLPEGKVMGTVTWLTSDNRYIRVKGITEENAKMGEYTAEVTAVDYTDKPITITARIGQSPNPVFSATCEVRVLKTGVEKVTLTGLEDTTPKTASISLGSSLQLSAAIEPKHATETDLIWTSSDENYATVSRTGKVTPQRKTETGKPVIITVSSKNNPDAKDTVAVTVTAHKVTGVRLEPADPVTLDKVGDTQKFVGSLVPSTADDTLRWGVKGGQTDSSTIAKNDIISLKSGGSNKVVIVTGLAPGETDVMVNVGDFTTSTTVTVSGIKFEKESLSVAVGKSAPVVKQLFGRAKNLNALDWEWKSDNDAVARVNPSTGLVSGIKPGTAKISCKNGIYSAEISVTVSESSATVLSYKMGDDKRYSFGEKILSDIRNQCKTAFEDSDLNYVTNLSVPPSQGTLYYGYVSETNPGQGVAASDKFYYKTSATASAHPADDYRYTTGKPSDKLLADVTFIPATGFSGKADISYTAVAENGKDLAGSIEITVPATTELRYNSPNGEAIRFHSNDFTTLSQASSGYPISSVRFNAPSERYGYLYYEYSGGDVYGSNITSGQRFYASSTPSLDSVAFVPRSGYNGTFPLTFTGWNTNGSSFTGTIRITVKSTSEGGGDITYSTLSGSRVYFDTSDFQALCRTATGGKLNYIQFTSLPSTDDASSSSSSSSAVLYHGSGSGSGSRIGTSSSIYATSSGSRWTIDDVYLLPSSTYTGSVTIPFKGWDTDRKTFEGTVVVNVTKDGGTAATIYMTCTGMPLVFRRADFDDACKDALPATLKSVRFSLPQNNSGTLYERFNDLNDRKALAEGTDIPAADLVTLSYLPKGESSGTVYISYTATDEKGNVCDGQVRITSDPNPVSLYFTDMNDTVWAIPSVNFLRSYGVVTGKGKKRYQPNATLKRGDFVLMLARAFGFQLNGSESFPDVPKDSYYAGAIAAAKSMNLVKGSGKNGSFRPEEEITRQEAATILYRVLQREQNLSAAETGYLTNYSDSGQIEDYALTAFATLVRDGIFEGSSGRIYPYAPLTRAQMAVILHRAIT